MRAKTMMAAQKKPAVSSGLGELVFSGSIRSALPAREPLQTVIYGKSFQATAPIGSAPVEIQCISGAVTVSGGSGGNMQLPVPELHGVCLGTAIPDAVLASDALMGGVWHDGTNYWISDTYEPCVIVGGALKSRLIRRCRSHNIVDTDPLSVVSKGMEWSPGGIITNGTGASLPGTLVLSTHFAAAGLINNGETVVISGTNIRFYYPRMQSYPVALWKSWLRREISGGRPLIVVYASDTPETTLGDPAALGAFAGQTVFSFTGTAQPCIKAGVLTHR